MNGHRHHDMGGLPGGPIEQTQHALEPWERKVDALLRLLADPARGPMVGVDELRRGIEELGPGAYDELSYYERWISSITNVLLEKGVLTVDELARRMDAVRRRHGDVP